MHHTYRGNDFEHNDYSYSVSTAFNYVMNRTVRTLSVGVFLNKESTKIDLTEMVQSIDISGETNNKLLLTGAVTHDCTIVIKPEDVTTGNDIVALANSGAVITGAWYSKDVTVWYNVPFPKYFVVECRRDINNGTITISCTDIIGMMARQKLSSVENWQTTTIINVIKNVSYYGVHAEVFDSTPPLGISDYLCGDYYTGDESLRDVINDYAMSGFRYAISTNNLTGRTGDKSKMAMIWLQSPEYNQEYPRVAEITCTKQTRVDNDGAYITYNIDSDAGAVTVTLNDESGYVIAEDTISGSSVFKSATTKPVFPRLLDIWIDTLYGTLAASVVSYAEHRGNPLMCAGEFIETEDGLFFANSISMHFDGGLTGVAQRDFDGLENTGANIASSIESNTNAITQLQSSVYANQDAIANLATGVQGLGDRVGAIEADTGWQPCYIGDTWENVSGLPLQARKVGRTVMVNGYITPVATWANDNYAYAAVVPEWARPPLPITAIAPSNWADRCTVYLSTDGTVVLYGHVRSNGASLPVNNGDHIDICLTYTV